jgi:Arc/MetJ-type ribon-helix-helix transcriptional regulator
MPRVEVEVSERTTRQLQEMVDGGYFESIEEAVRVCIAVVLALAKS